jgi:predicted pyridoxine 5'-phosphate oxidase superfamily flavin-nucleotide-binding protein
MTGLIGFHDGELAVQERAGVRAAAARLSGMLAAPDLRGGAARFLADRRLAALCARDNAGQLWISPLLGPRGFLDPTAATTLLIHTTPTGADPLQRLPAGQPAGLIAIDFATRRRVRVNGTLTAVNPDGLELDVDQAYGNCPQYIQQRQLSRGPASRPATGTADARWATALSPADVRLIRGADTFMFGTTHPDRGNDASHRGGPPGFVRVRASSRDTAGPTEIRWPDYAGNNMFNSLGNLSVDPTAALWFADFATGDTLHLSGVASLDWDAGGGAGDDAHTGRRVRFTVHTAVAGHRDVPYDAEVTPSPHNPPLST